MVTAIRPLLESDSLVNLTDLLHRAYAPLGYLGLNYTAIDQTAEETARRISRGTCAVAEIDGSVVGTITVIRARPDRATPWYCRPYVASAHQFAVEPKLQGRGIGSALMHWAETWALEQGYSQLAVDTAEPAHHLIAYYVKRGYRFIEFAQWPGKRYRSAIYSKGLPSPPLPVQTPMGLATPLSVLPAAAHERSLIEDMMEHYLADLSGTGPYPYLEQYWKEPGRHPYLLRYGDHLVGFALVRRLDDGSNYELVEFYVATSLRRHGFGSLAARALFNSHVGTWSVSVRRDNAVGQKFWASLFGHLASVTQYERQAPDGIVYEFNSPVE